MKLFLILLFFIPINNYAFAQKKCSKIIKKKGRPGIEINDIYGFLRFMISKKTPLSLFVLKRFEVNDPKLVALAKEYKLGFQPVTIRNYIRRNKDIKWPELLREVNLDYKKIQEQVKIEELAKKNKKLITEKIINFFKFLKNENIKIEEFEIDNFINNSPFLIKKLAEFGLDLTPKDIATHLINNSRAWNKVLAKANVVLKANVDQKAYRAQLKKNELISRGIKEATDIINQMKADEIPLFNFDFGSKYFRNNKEKDQKYLETSFFSSRRAIKEHLDKYYDGKWDQFLLDKGLDPKEVKGSRSTYMIEKGIKEATDIINQMKSDNLPLFNFSSEYFRLNKGKAKDYLHMTSLPSTNAVRLHINNNYEGRWDKFLLNNDLNPKKVKAHRSVYIKEQKTKEAFNFINQLKVEDIPLSDFSAVHFERQRGLAPQFLSSKLFPTTTSIYLHIRTTYNGGWDKFLADNNLNPDFVRIIGFADYWKLSKDFKNERKQRDSREKAIAKGGRANEYEGDIKKNIVVDHNTPERLLVIENTKVGLEQALETIDSKSAKLIDIALDFLADSINKPTDLMSNKFKIYYEEITGRNFVESDLIEAFKQLKNNEAINLLD